MRIGFVLTLLVLLVACKKDDGISAPTISAFHPLSGSAGNTVTITGKNFSATAANNVIMFNGAIAELVSVTPTNILAKVPQEATSGPITVSVGDLTGTSEETFTVVLPVADDPNFYFGSDLSYVNQIVDHGGQYRENGQVKDPYQIFKDHGNDLVRLRIWHNPVWTKEVYDPDGPHLYNELFDVERSIAASKQRGMKTLLDFHYSDIWADPGAQEIPAAWTNIKDINVLRDSVYNYTFKTLQYLKNKGLTPEFVQIGNEINCGMLYEYNQTPVTGFPSCNICNSQWSNLKTVINSGIKAVRDVSASTKILLHVADPANVDWWFDGVIAAGVTDFDIIGFSYYPIWHTAVSVSQLSDRVAAFKTKYTRDVMILETAYPWTGGGADSYGNIFGSQTPISGYPYSQQGQFEMMKAITQEMVAGGGSGIVYWEPAWITSSIRDYWNTGSAWENSTFFDFNGNAIQGIDYMKQDYDR